MIATGQTQLLQGQWKVVRNYEDQEYIIIYLIAHMMSQKETD